MKDKKMVQSSDPHLQLQIFNEYWRVLYYIEK